MSNIFDSRGQDSETNNSTTPRILWVTPNLCKTSGGPTSTVTNGLMAEKSAGFESELVSTWGKDRVGEAPAVSLLESAGIQLHVFQRFDGFPNSVAWGLSLPLTFWMIRNIRHYDLLHLQYVWCWTTLLGSILGRLYRVPIVLTPHESLTQYDIDVASRSKFKRLLKRVLRPFILRSTSCLFLMSPLEVRDTEARNVPVLEIPHALPEPALGPKRSSREAGNSARPVIGFIGRNIPKKGIDRLLRAMAISGHRNWNLRVAGPPASKQLRAEYDSLITDLDLNSRVRWLGFVQDREGFLSDLDVLVMPSEYEGFGMVAAEAMYCDTPVVVPRESGIAPLVEESGGGVVVEHPDPNSLAKAINDLVADPETLSLAGQRARKAVARQHSPSSFAANTGRAYGSILSRQAEPPG